MTGSAFGYRHLAGALTAAAQPGTLLPDYRLAPKHPFPAALEGALRAYLWILDSQGGIDPRQVTLAGDPSGGGLVLSLLLSLKQQQAPMPGGAVLLCPGADLTGASLKHRPADQPQPAMTAEQLRHVAALYLAGHPFDDPAVRPLTADLTGLPPLLIQAATGDFAREDAKRLSEHARRQEVDVQLELYPVATHAFQVFWTFLPRSRRRTPTSRPLRPRRAHHHTPSLSSSRP